MVIVGLDQNPKQGFAVIADVERGGLGELLRQDFPSGSNGGLTVLGEESLNAASDSPSASGGYALIRAHEVVFSNSIDTLQRIDAQLNAGASGFATTDFGQQIAAAYSRGAGIILAANLNQIFAEQALRLRGNPSANALGENSGISSVRYLIAEHRETNGSPENHLNLQFSGTRQRVASWLGSPAPMGSLDFVSTNAALAMVGLSKEPTAIADDMLAMFSANSDALGKWNQVQSGLQVDFRNDLAANLGGEFLFAVDGPVLPTPSWKVVVEVRDSARIEQTIEHLAQAIDTQAQANGGHGIAIDSTNVGSQTFYGVRDVASGTTVAQYTFSGGYMIVAPTRVLLMDALSTNSSGNSLSRSTSFRALLPRDPNENYSAIAYQNLSPVANSLLPHLSGETADAVRELASDSRPTAVCAWGKDAGIEAASNSRLFGFDFLLFGKVLGIGHPSHAGTTEQIN
jgi:hypothetical protein